ncbi:MAG: RyR domain-containing protein [Pseudomonadota bacterium]
MLGQKLRSKPFWDIPIGLVVLVGAIAFVLAFAGWMLHLTELGPWDRFQVSFYRALGVNALSDAYGESFAKRQIFGLPAVLLTCARWLGVLTFTFLLVKAYQGLFSEGFTRFVAKGRSGHIVVVGDTRFARAAAEAAASRDFTVVWATDEGQTSTDKKLIRVVEPLDGNRLVQATAAHQAHSVLVATGEDAKTFAVTRDMLTAPEVFGELAEQASNPLQGPHFFSVVSDRWNLYPDEAADLINPAPVSKDSQGRKGGLDSVGEFITESRTAARVVLNSAPLFVLAENRPQHAVIVGLGDFGESLLTEICEGQRTDLYARQKITIIDKTAKTWEAFKSRVPDHELVFDSTFFEIDLQNAGNVDAKWQALFQHMSLYPVTAAYVATGRSANSRLVASELRMRLLTLSDADTQAQAQNTPPGLQRPDPLSFPIFAYSRDSGDRNRPVDQHKKSQLPIIPFGAWPDLVSAARLFDIEPDEHAYAIHKTHHEMNSDGDTPPPLWRDIKETDRYSSRSASANVPALLWAAGYDLTAWYNEARAKGEPITLNRMPKLAEAPDFTKEQPLLMYLARLEHERWCAERRLRGYRFGPSKDLARRRHPSLVSFDDLSEGAQTYNIAYIRSLFTMVAARDVPETVHRGAGVKAIARPTDIALLAKLGLLVTPPERDAEADDGNV